MKVCYFGIYNSDYARNKILISGLRQNNVEVIECCDRTKSCLKYVYLIKKYIGLKGQFDVMVVGFPGQGVMPLAKLLCRKKIVFDAFLSLYDSNVFDRRIVRPKSLRARYFWFLDWLACRLADKILLDTQQHIDYFVSTFKINPNKFSRIFIGADNQIFYPIVKSNSKKKQSEYFTVHFHGTYIPLQGIEYIVEAANYLRGEKIRFQLVGRGQLFNRVQKYIEDSKLNKHIILIDLVPQDQVAKLIGKSDICLGIFGATEKAKRVIPNKLYECLAMAKPVITADTVAVREAFLTNQDLATCKIADGLSLAKKIKALKIDLELRNKIANQGYKLYKEKFCPKVLGRDLKNIIKKI